MPGTCLAISCQLLNCLASGCFRGFSEKKRLNTHGFAREYLRSCSLYGPGRRQPLGGSISLKFLLETKLQSESFDIWMTRWGFGFKNYDVSS